MTHVFRRQPLMTCQHQSDANMGRVRGASPPAAFIWTNVCPNGSLANTSAFRNQIQLVPPTEPMANTSQLSPTRPLLDVTPQLLANTLDCQHEPSSANTIAARNRDLASFANRLHGHQSDDLANTPGCQRQRYEFAGDTEAIPQSVARSADRRPAAHSSRSLGRHEASTRGPRAQGAAGDLVRIPTRWRTRALSRRA